MATLHISGKAKKALILADSSLPVYMLFSSQDTAESNSFSINQNLIIGGSRVTKRTILAPSSSSLGTPVTYGGTNYKAISGALSDLVTAKADKLLLESPLTIDVTPAGTVVKSIFLVSYVQGIVPTNKAFVPSAELNNITVNYVIEAVHKLSEPITVSPTATLNVGLILEM